jgi:HD-GYP domain-containing protein (c-di-GMP phosphodiesterase class II)
LNKAIKEFQMKNISVIGLTPNFYFSAPVFLEKDYILLTPEMPVTQSLLDRLRKWNYTFIFSEGDSSGKPGDGKENIIPKNEGILDKTIQQDEINERIVSFYSELIVFMDGFINNLKTKNELDLSLLTDKIKQILEIFKTDKDQLLTLTAPRKLDVDNYFIPHVVNSALICLAIGDYLKMPTHKLIDLGNAAFLHEIGMTKIPSALYLKPGELTTEEKKTISTHTIWGYKILKGFSVPENVATGALEHHERLDGTGYPRRIKGDAITYNPRIIAVACSYDTAVSYRPFKQPLDGHAVILHLITTQKSRFDDAILKALVFTLSVFPLGTHVILSNGTKGIVYKTNPTDPKFPQVKLTNDEKGKKIMEHILVPTSKEKGITIVRTLKPQEYENN